MAEQVFTPGTELVMREVLHGAEWAHWPEQVISDDGPDGVLATLQPTGTRLTFPRTRRRTPGATSTRGRARRCSS